MADTEPRLGDFDVAGDDHVVPFEVEPLDVRGRAVQLGPVIDRILARHDYPEPVSRLLAEAIVLAVLVGTSLKFEGKFILQTRSDGPVDLLVADFATPHAVRGYARFDADRLAEAIVAGKISSADLLGQGVLALTIDQGPNTQRYQGIVQLDATSLEDVARIYFKQSEQIPTEVRLSVAKQIIPGESGRREHWRAGGMLAQFLPSAPERMLVRDLPGGDDPDADEDEEDDGPEDNSWRELVALMETVEDDELFDPTVGAERLLFRLFNEHGVRVFDSIEVRDECTCSRDKIRGVLQGFSAEEIEDSIEDGKIKVSCEFCSTNYEFDPSEFLGKD